MQARDRRGQPPTIQISADIHQALVDYCNRGEEQRVIRQVASIAICEFLARQGIEAPKPAPGSFRLKVRHSC